MCLRSACWPATQPAAPQHSRMAPPAVYRTALNYARSRKRKCVSEYAETLPESTVAADEIRELVDEAVAGLPESCREPWCAIS